MNELVSIVMPAYNGQKYISKAIKSVINQSYENWELIIVDDCSVDNTYDVAKKFADSRIKLYKNSHNKGIAATRNRALDMCKGEYICLLDDDDIYAPDKIMKQVIYMNNHPLVDLLGGKCVWIDENDNIISEEKKAITNSDYLSAYALLLNPFWNCEVMMRRKSIVEANMHYEEEGLGLEDYIFWITAISKYNLVANEIDELLLFHRRHRDNETFKVRNEKLFLRKNKYYQIRANSILYKGIYLSENSKLIINRYISEDGFHEVCSYEDADMLYKAFQEIVCKAKDQLPQINKVCHDLYYSVISMSNGLWWESNIE